MRRMFALAFGLSFLAMGGASAAPVSFKAADQVQVFGETTAAVGPAKGVILLFHMAGSNAGEYAPIAPRLAKLGWNTLAIDQRSGGSAFGHRNETVAHFGRSTGYEAALPDLEAALAHARQTWPGQRVLVWGSSYSAALVFVLAARHQGEIAGLLAFSPGEYLSGLSARDAAAKLTIPLFATGASDAGEQRAAEQILKASPSAVKEQFSPRQGQHGSSTLRDDGNPGGAAANWTAVEKFLARF